MRHTSAVSLVACIALASACSDSAGPPPPPPIGLLATISIRSGDGQTALAGTSVPTPPVVVPLDDQSRTVPNQTATFTVVAGGGTIDNTTGTVNADGSVTAPTWTLGKSAVTQQLMVTMEGKTAIVNAN